ncbi:MAG: glycoside hydrolase family 140 protein [Bryobacteraceae bacterium]
MRPFFRILAIATAAAVCGAQPGPGVPPKLRVSQNRRFLETADGRPFFYLGDTAWELFHRLNRQEAARYLDLRARQRYNVIQAVALAELEGIADPNAYGDLPLADGDPARPAVTAGADSSNAAQYDYWDHVDYIVDQANRRGLYIGLLPTWARWTPHPNARPGVIFTEQNAEAYGTFLGKRYGQKGIIWILGGDRSAEGFQNVWRAMARGIAIGVNGKEDYAGLTMTYHPNGGHSSSEYFANEHWLTFHMQQTGHRPAQRAPVWETITADYTREPVKPVMDGEPLYEDHPIGFRQAKELGYSFDAHVRQRAYWDVFSGAFGHTYGNHAVWQMYAKKRKAINGPLFFWHEAMHRPGAAQMQYVRALVESRPFLERIPDQSLVAAPLDGADYIAATRGTAYAFIYTAQGRPITVALGKITGERVRAWWFNPRNGSADEIGVFENRGLREFQPPSLGGFGADAVLVLDDAARNWGAPGAASFAGR